MINVGSSIRVAGYARADTATAHTRTVMGGGGVHVDAPTPLMGGVTFGGVALTAPNTSPDVVTVAALLHEKHFESTNSGIVTALAGTPVCVSPNGYDGRSDPMHTIVLGLGAAPAAHTGEHAAAFTKCTEQKGTFVTVLVGPTTFRKGRAPTHVAVAIQNVATVITARSAFEALDNDVVVGSPLVLGVKEVDGRPGVHAVADLANCKFTVARYITPVTDSLAGRTRADLGAPLVQA